MTTWRLRIDDGVGAPDDVLLRADPSGSLGDLVGALHTAGYTGAPVRVDGREAPADAAISSVGLVHGSTIQLPGADHESRPRLPGRYLLVVSGPEAGAWAKLPDTGRLTVGRADTADVQIRDALISGHHLSLDLTAEGSVVIEDLDSSNGTFVEDEALGAPTNLEPGQYVRAGATVLTVMDVGPGELPALSAARAGTRSFQRHFRPALTPLPDEVLPPAEPRDPDDDRGRSWWQFLLPMATGVGFAVYTGRLIFLVIIAIAPIAMLANHLVRRRRDAAKRAAEQETYEQELAAHRRELARLHAEEQRRPRHAAVVGGQAVLLAELGHQRLWEREPSDDDYLDVCIGLATQPSRIQTSKERGAPTARLWGMPLSVPLAKTGSLLVAGERARARAVGRSIVLNLTTTHSPLDVRVSILTTDDRHEDWNWARWLPHTHLGETTAAVYTTPDQRESIVTAMIQQIDTWEGDPPAQAHVVVVDGADVVEAENLTSILRRGSTAGVYGVVLDDRVVPEGVQGTLRLGELPDEGEFASRDLAEVSGILTAELSPSWALKAALGLAGLRPASADDSGRSASQVHLTDMLADGTITPAWVADRWRQSPCESVVVGLSGRTPTLVDIVRHGPHAIVGGKTRSGKTEFLLTWLTALCLHNSPDDLAIFVADFKGGVDHVQTAQLPHVISLSTNQDIRGFERTMLMLEAEIKRREHLYASVGTSNIEAYRVARRRDDSLLPVPRLLVVVDEFSELRQTDREGGSGYMNRLATVARVGAGLGIHLILVTQNFSGGQLPEQIDSQVGLGICFRVNEAADSKVVLHSGIASTIPDDRPGRAWARMQGQDLVEFQSARVAGRRRDLDDSDVDITVERVPFSTIAVASAFETAGSVPHDQTDLAVIIDTVNEVAAGKVPALPWPDELDPAVTLADLIEWSRAESLPGAPIGLADEPTAQRQVPVTVDGRHEQVVVIGSAGGEVGQMLLTIATSEALAAPPDGLHVYGIDLEGNWLQPLEHLPHTGAVACLNDDLALRIVARLRAEAERRRALFDDAGVNDATEYRETTHRPLPRIRLHLNGADRLAGSSGADVSPLHRPVSGLVADAPGTDVGVVIGGGAGLLGKRLTQRATRRFILAQSDHSNYAMAGVPREVVADLHASGRAYDVDESALVQLGAISTGEHRPADVIHTLGAELRGLHGERGEDGWPPALPEVRWPLVWSRLDPHSLHPPAGFEWALPVGIDTDTALWRWLEAEDDGPILAIAGDGRSGRSATLVALHALAERVGWATQVVAPARRSLVHRLDVPIHRDVSALQPATVSPTLFLIDDANRLDGTDGELEKVLSESTRPVVIAMAGPIDMFGRKTGVLRGTPDLRASITLAPRTTTAAGNAKIPDHLRTEPRAGRGVLWVAGEMAGVQVPLHPLSSGDGQR